MIHTFQLIPFNYNFIIYNISKFYLIIENLI